MRLLRFPSQLPAVAFKLDLRALDRLRRGESEALAALYRQFAAEAYRWALSIVGERQDAEDVVHDVFIGLPQALGAYEERGEFAAWFRTVVNRTALQHRRRRRRREHLLGVHFLQLVSRREVAPTPATSPNDLLKHLTQSQREVFVLRFYQDMPFAEIAALLRIREATARARYLRSLRTLRKVAAE